MRDTHANLGGPQGPALDASREKGAVEVAAAEAFLADELVALLRLKERLGDLQGLAVLEPGHGRRRLTRHLAGWVGPEGSVLSGGTEDPRVAERSLDLVLLFCVFPCLVDPPSALARLARGLRPGGRLVISELGRSVRPVPTPPAPDVDRPMPAHAALIGMLNGAGLRLTELVDREEEFYCEAVAEPCEHGA